MKKVIFLLLLLGLLPCLIWAQEYNIKPGVTLTKDNYEKYLPQLEKLIFPAHLHYVIKGLKNGWITVPIVEKREYHTLNGFVKATLGNAGKYKVGKDNKLIGPPWRGGLPFPDPKTGAELGWNAYKRQQAEHESFLSGRCWPAPATMSASRPAFSGLALSTSCSIPYRRVSMLESFSDFSMLVVPTRTGLPFFE